MNYIVCEKMSILRRRELSKVKEIRAGDIWEGADGSIKYCGLSRPCPDCYKGDI